MTNTSKKGITAVVAIVLLLMMTVAAAGLAYMWVSGMQKGAQETTSGQVQAQQELMQGALVIDSVWNNTGRMSFVLRNSGTVAFNDLSAFTYYINGAKTTNPGTLTGALAPGKTTQIDDTSTVFPIIPGTVKTIKLVAPNGVEVSHICNIQTATQNSC